MGYIPSDNDPNAFGFNHVLGPAWEKSEREEFLRQLERAKTWRAIVHPLKTSPEFVWVQYEAPPRNATVLVYRGLRLHDLPMYMRIGQRARRLCSATTMGTSEKEWKGYFQDLGRLINRDIRPYLFWRDAVQGGYDENNINVEPLESRFAKAYWRRRSDSSALLSAP